MRALHRFFPPIRHEPRQSRRLEQKNTTRIISGSKRSFPNRAIWTWSSRARILKKTGSLPSGSARSCWRRRTCSPDVWYKGDLPMMGVKALLFAPENDLVNIKKTLQGGFPVHPKICPDDKPGFRFLNRSTPPFRTAPRETNAQTESLIQSLPALTRIVTQADASLNGTRYTAVAGGDGLVKCRRRSGAPNLSHIRQWKNFPGDGACTGS